MAESVLTTSKKISDFPFAFTGNVKDTFKYYIYNWNIAVGLESVLPLEGKA